MKSTWPAAPAAWGHEGGFHAPLSHGPRQAAAVVLRWSARRLARWARALTPPPRRAAPPWVEVEFQADGEGGGRVFVDGQLVARLPDVSRL